MFARGCATISYFTSDLWSVSSRVLPPGVFKTAGSMTTVMNWGHDKIRRKTVESIQPQVFTEKISRYLLFTQRMSE